MLPLKKLSQNSLIVGRRHTSDRLAILVFSMPTVRILSSSFSTVFLSDSNVSSVKMFSIDVIPNYHNFSNKYWEQKQPTTINAKYEIKFFKWTKSKECVNLSVEFYGKGPTTAYLIRINWKRAAYAAWAHAKINWNKWMALMQLKRTNVDGQ